jgi:hypothetical protein
MGTRSLLGTEDRWRHLVVVVFRPEVASQSNDVTEPTGTLGH